jgi:uncharacterized membrane protein
MSPKQSLLLGIVSLVAAALLGWSFARSYRLAEREGYESWLLLIGGGVIVICLAVVGFRQLIKGFRQQ